MANLTLPRGQSHFRTSRPLLLKLDISLFNTYTYRNITIWHTRAVTALQRRLAAARLVVLFPLCHKPTEGQKMKQKYTISKNDDNSSITITEYSEVDKDIYAQLCAETFAIADLPDGLQDNPETVIQTFRTRNMFPPRDYALRIAVSMAQLLADDSQSIVEVKIDDKAEITERRLAAEKLAEEAMGDVLEDDELDTILETDTATTTLSKAEATNK